MLTDITRDVFVPPHRRRIGLVFQDAQMLPHLSVRANLIYGQVFTPRSERRLVLTTVVDVLDIGHLLERNPVTLSGGERQRVAIGRALLTSPRLLLMDEPLASLDQARKDEILPFIERMRDEFQVPIVYVSHAAEEVTRLASQVIMIENGRRVAGGSPARLLAGPKHGPFMLAGQPFSHVMARVRRYLPEYGITSLVHPAGDLALPGYRGPEGSAVRLSIRAHDLTLFPWATPCPNGFNGLEGVLVSIEPMDGAFVRAKLELKGGEHLAAILTRYALDKLSLRTGDRVLGLFADAHTEAAADRASQP
jgi:molybdate transport system ATP-binding protein